MSCAIDTAAVVQSSVPHKSVDTCGQRRTESCLKHPRATLAPTLRAAKTRICFPRLCGLPMLWNDASLCAACYAASFVHLCTPIVQWWNRVLASLSYFCSRGACESHNKTAILKVHLYSHAFFNSTERPLAMQDVYYAKIIANYFPYGDGEGNVTPVGRCGILPWKKTQGRHQLVWSVVSGEPSTRLSRSTWVGIPKEGKTLLKQPGLSSKWQIIQMILPTKLFPLCWPSIELNTKSLRVLWPGSMTGCVPCWLRIHAIWGLCWPNVLSLWSSALCGSRPYLCEHGLDFISHCKTICTCTCVAASSINPSVTFSFVSRMFRKPCQDMRSWCVISALWLPIQSSPRNAACLHRKNPE